VTNPVASQTSFTKSFKDNLSIDLDRNRQRRLLIASALLLPFVITVSTLVAEPSMAQTSSARMLASEALPLVQSGEMILVDIRTPEEWAQTGVAEPAHVNSMHVPGFLERLDEILDGSKDSQIALICATGGRSAYLQGELKKRGYKNVIDVTDGMIGSGAGPGWLGNGYATRKVE